MEGTQAIIINNFLTNDFGLQTKVVGRWNSLWSMKIKSGFRPDATTFVEEIDLRLQH